MRTLEMEHPLCTGVPHLQHRTWCMCETRLALICGSLEACAASRAMNLLGESAAFMPRRGVRNSALAVRNRTAAARPFPCARDFPSRRTSAVREPQDLSGSIDLPAMWSHPPRDATPQRGDSIASQRHDRRNAHGSRHRNRARECADGKEHHRPQQECEAVVRADPVEQRRQRPSQSD